MVWITVITWLVLCIVVASVASSMGRSGGSYFALSLFLSPLIGFIVLAIKGRPTEEERFYLDERVYFCTQCGRLFKYSGKNPCYCDRCMIVTKPTTVLANEWSVLSEEQQNAIKEAFARGEYMAQVPGSGIAASEAGAPQTEISKETSSADELKKYKELLDMGAITEEEYNAKKKQILGL